jgi:hypothetical protein
LIVLALASAFSASACAQGQVSLPDAPAASSQANPVKVIPEAPLLEAELLRHGDDSPSVEVLFASEYLSCRFYEHAVVKHLVRAADGSPHSFFTSVPTNFSSYDLFPNIVHRNNAGEWIRTAIPAIADGWSYVHRYDKGKRFLILMDNIPESPGGETRVVLSEDGGQSWRDGESLRKYVYFDGIQFLPMSSSGSGIAVEYYDGDGGDEDIGYCVFKTTDWGSTWSERAYETNFDTSRFVDTFDGIHTLRNGMTALSDFDLPGFESCAPE